MDIVVPEPLCCRASQASSPVASQILDEIGATRTFVCVNLLLPVNLELQSGEPAGNQFPRDSITLNVSLVSQSVQYVLLEVLIQVAAAAIVSCPVSVTDLFRLEVRTYLRDLLSRVRE
jgi:hypothetical protein